MTTYYGNHEDEQYPIATQIWGHRLRTGQHWIEYMLEFLSVLSGFGYRFGQGLLDCKGQDDYLDKYTIPRRLGLRRFVFYDEREKTRDSRDTRATAELRSLLRDRLVEVEGRVEGDLLDEIRALLRSFSAVEEDRSWYAKSLFPVNESFLLWEATRKGSTLKEYRHAVSDLDLAELDRGMEFRARNFFARGGELYYLMISAGTEQDLERRRRIGARLKQLLTANNTALGQLASQINAAWEDVGKDKITGTLGWIPDQHCALYQQMAADLDTFLDNRLDSLECLELLAHLIGFHIVTYIYHRAHPASDPEGHQSGSCLDACRPELLLDLLGDEDGGIVRDSSAGLLREQDDRQLRRARDLVRDRVRSWIPASADPNAIFAALDAEAKDAFGSAKTRSKAKVDKGVGELQARYAAGDLDQEALIQNYSERIFEGHSHEFRRNFLAVHRKVGRAIGLIAPRKGSQVRFVIGDTLLKTLVLACLPPQSPPVPFGDFLETLYLKYGIIVGSGEAHLAGLVDRLRINEEYYSRNREALRVRMQRAGLVTQYSDATELVYRR